MIRTPDVSIYPMITPTDDDERLIAMMCHEISAGFDAVLQAEPPSAARLSAAVGAVAGTAAAIISMMPREAQAQFLSMMIKAIRQRLREIAEEPRMTNH